MRSSVLLLELETSDVYRPLSDKMQNDLFSQNKPDISVTVVAILQPVRLDDRGSIPFITVVS